MPNTYTLKITGLTCKPSLDGLSNVVTYVQWAYDATDGVFTTSMSGSTQLPEPDPTSFNPFEVLTESVVLQWVADHTDPTVLPYYAAQMDDWLAAQHNPPVVSPPLPWSLTDAT